jgi:hypothetical protein
VAEERESGGHRVYHGRAPNPSVQACVGDLRRRHEICSEMMVGLDLR